MRTILFVVGMHRSGTSALTAALRACGASTGDDVIPAQESVNSDGFWEDRRVVELNDAILKKSGLDWYLLNIDGKLITDINDDQLASKIIADGFGNGSVELVKDPRFCITLPFWFKACNALDVQIKICVIERDWNEVAHSLQKRDGFPLSYGYALAKLYGELIKQNTSEIQDKVAITYNNLLASPKEILSKIITDLSLPLTLDKSAIENAVKRNLKHNNMEDQIQCSDEKHTYSKLLNEVVEEFVERGKKLSRLGDEHSEALEVMNLRDKQLADTQRQLETLGDEHAEALEVIKLRDEQLQNLGQQHSYAISIVEERDKQLSERNKEIESLQEELQFYKPWKNRILCSLGFIKRKSDK